MSVGVSRELSFNRSQPTMKFHFLDGETLAWAQIGRLNWEPAPGPCPYDRLAVPGEAIVAFGNPNTKKLHDFEPTNTDGVFLFADHVARQIIEAGFKGIDFHPVRVREYPRRVPAAQAPRYVWGRITGRIGGIPYVDGKPAPLDPTGTAILKATSTAGRLREFHLDINKWDGSDFCRMIPIGMGGTLCSARFAEAARANRWSNFNFRRTTSEDLRIGL